MHYITELLNDVNSATQDAKIKWTDFSYNNDACNSIGFDLDKSGENYVQLFAFASQEDADAEGLDVYGITVCVDGDTTYDEWSGNDRDEAIAKALSKALEIEISFTQS